MDVSKLTTIIVLLTIKLLAFASDQHCIPRSFGLDSIVCVCNATCCDTVSEIKPMSPSEYVLYVSNQAGLRFRKTQNFFIDTHKGSVKSKSIIVNPDVTYQTLIGWGGALTDAAGFNLHCLNEGTKENLLRSYFSNNGIEFNLVRVPMGSTDFSTHSYSYDDGDEDEELENFKLAPEDYKYKIPLLQRAIKLSNSTLWLLASAWTAPKWMKTNRKYDGLGSLKPSMYQAWAMYFLKFLQLYWEQWIDFWGITTGNQPITTRFIPDVQINNVRWLPHQMRFWINHHLGPTFRNSGFSSIKLLTFDDQTRFLQAYVNQLFMSRITENYVDGIAVHSHLNINISYNSLNFIQNNFPDKFILNTEASSVKRVLNPLQAPASVPLGAWQSAESYANDIIMNLENWVTGWMTSNIALDMAGGPTYVRSADSTIIVNTAADEFYKQPSYYAIGHFSKFIPRGSIRIDVSKYNANLQIVAFRKPDRGIVIVILNRKNDYVPVILNDKERGNIDITIGPKSVTTILYW